MLVRDILRSKGSSVVTIGPDATVLEATRLLVARAIGALVVLEAEEIVGIISERDALRLAAVDPASLATTRVHEAMTTTLVVGVADDGIDYVMEAMTKNRIRHLPVVEDQRLIGILSIGDVVNALRRETESENRYLHDYIAGMVR